MSWRPPGIPARLGLAPLPLRARMRTSMIPQLLTPFQWNPMARISLIEPEQHPELEPVLAKIRSGRRGNIINVYKLLLHTPAIAEVWLDLINAVRWKVDLDGRLREIVIIRIGYLNGCSYVVNQHVPLHSAPEGLTQAECDALMDWRATDKFS